MRTGAQLLGLLFLAAAAVAPAPARAVVVERVVAIVGDRPILLSELRTRARPFLLQIQLKVPPGAHQTAAESQVLKDLIDKMVDEQLESQAADKAHIQISEGEVNNAFANIAAAQNLTLPQLFRDAQARSGLTEQEYHDEIQRQLLEGKMLQLRVKGRVRVTEEDVKAIFERTVRDEKHRRDYRPSWIVLRLMPGSSAAAIQSRFDLAQTLCDQARRGADFADLARRYSDDTKTRDQGGDLGVKAPINSQDALGGKYAPLAQELEDKLMVLEPGQVAEPTKYGDAVVVIKLLSRQPSRYAAGFEAAKQEMIGRLQGEIMERAKKKWLEELKARMHVTVRL